MLCTQAEYILNCSCLIIMVGILVPMLLKYAPKLYNVNMHDRYFILIIIYYIFIIVINVVERTSVHAFKISDFNNNKE